MGGRVIKGREGRFYSCTNRCSVRGALGQYTCICDIFSRDILLDKIRVILVGCFFHSISSYTLLVLFYASYDLEFMDYYLSKMRRKVGFM